MAGVVTIDGGAERTKGQAFAWPSLFKRAACYEAATPVSQVGSPSCMPAGEPVGAVTAPMKI